MIHPKVSIAAAPLLVAVVALLPGCGDDESSDTLATNSTTSTSSTSTPSTTAAPASSTSSSTPSTSEGSTSSTTVPPDSESPEAGRAVLAMVSGVNPMEITECDSGGESSLNLSATDDDGDVLEVRARNDLGVVTYRGPQEAREGTTVRVTVGEDGRFNVVGALNGEEFTLTGKCA